MKQGWPCVDKFWSWVTRDSFYYSLHICIHLKFSMKWGNNEKPCMTFVEKITKDLKEELKIYFSWTERLHMISVQFSSVQSLSCVWLFATPWTAGHQASLSITNSWSLLKLMPLSWWCHQTISSSVVPFSRLWSFPVSGSFQMSWLFTSGGQSIGVSASTSVLPMSIQDWFPLGWTGWISLQSKGLSRVFSNTTVQKHQFSPIKSVNSIQFHKNPNKQDNCEKNRGGVLT